ncbi:MAG: hypothetical protein ACLFUK_08940 [Halanaerobium sp.]
MNKFIIHSIAVLFFAFLLAIIISYPIKAIGVQPLVFDLEMEPGETKEFQLELTPENNEENAVLNLYSFTQQETGGLAYEEGNPEEHNVLNWLDLPEEVTVPPGEETAVTGEVSVPYDAQGSHTAVVMVEPVVENEEGITLQVRYAVRVNIHVDSSGLREDIELQNFELTADENDHPVISTRLHNNSSLLYDAAGEVTIRDQNRQLIERVTLRSDYAAENNNDATTIYPDSEVVFDGQITEVLPAGEYDLQLFLRYADGRQLIERKTVEVGDQFVDSETMEYIEVEPETINQELRRGGAHTEPINISNRTGDQVDVQLSTQEIKSNYEHSLLDKFELQLRGEQNTTIEGRRSVRPVLIVRSPREDIEDGGYYDKLRINVFDSETEERLQSKTIDLAFVVGEDFDYGAEIQDLQAKRTGEEVLFSSTVLNQSDIHFAPQARVYLKQDEEVMETINLELAEEEDYILPEMTGLLRTRVQDIEAGKYTAEVTVLEGENEISVREFELEIASEEEESQ